jgi:hypothetical protein
MTKKSTDFLSLMTMVNNKKQVMMVFHFKSGTRTYFTLVFLFFQHYFVIVESYSVSSFQVGWSLTCCCTLVRAIQVARTFRLKLCPTIPTRFIIKLALWPRFRCCSDWVVSFKTVQSGSPLPQLHHSIRSLSIINFLLGCWLSLRDFPAIHLVLIEGSPPSHPMLMLRWKFLP